MRTLLKWIGGILIIILLMIHFYLPRLITEIRNPLAEKYRYHPRPPKEQFSEKITFKSFDGLNLTAGMIEPPTDSVRATVILVHGIRSRKEFSYAFGSQLAKQGYRIVAVDLRAHGESEGNHCTFGAKEKKDISSLIDYLQTNLQLSEPFGIWGHSLGGAVALDALATDSRIEFGIIESTFSRFRTIVGDYFEIYFDFEIPVFTDYLVYRAGKIANFDPDEANPIEYCKEIEQPVLMAHGTRDNRISIEYGKANFAKLKSEDKNFIEIAGARHMGIHRVGGEEYASKIISFLNRQTSWHHSQKMQSLNQTVTTSDIN